MFGNRSSITTAITRDTPCIGTSQTRKLNASKLGVNYVYPDESTTRSFPFLQYPITFLSK